MVMMLFKRYRHRLDRGFKKARKNASPKKLELKGE